jgi:homoserine O-succinyltransferase
MPIKIPDDLPARATLGVEGVMVMGEADAVRQDIRPLRIGLLNHVARNTPSEHIISFYRDFEDIRPERFDGFIVTGAPVETMPFEQVTYWDELRRVFDWTQTNVHAVLNICWGAQAAVYHFHGMPKYQLPHKAFGVYRHRNLAPASPYLRGVSDDFSIPVSRWTEVRRQDIPKSSGMSILMESDEAGLCLLDDPAHYSLHMFNHIEYDSNSLSDEYFRDVAANKSIEIPRNYFPKDDPTRQPENRWRSHAHLLFGNWINQIYQTAPFDLEKIGHR